MIITLVFKTKNYVNIYLGFKISFIIFKFLVLSSLLQMIECSVVYTHNNYAILLFYSLICMLIFIQNILIALNYTLNHSYFLQQGLLSYSDKFFYRKQSNLLSWLERLMKNQMGAHDYSINKHVYILNNFINFKINKYINF